MRREEFFHSVIPVCKGKDIEALEKGKLSEKLKMLRHSLATLEGELEFLVFYRALLSLSCSPLSLFVALLYLNLGCDRGNSCKYYDVECPLGEGASGWIPTIPFVKNNGLTLIIGKNAV